MRKTKKTLIEQDEICDVYCNMCGNPIPKDNFGKLYDYLSVDKQWGYLSLLDGHNHSFDLCDKCYIDIISKFKINILNSDK